MSKENLNIINQMLKISKYALKAEKMRDMTVEYHRKEVLDEGANILEKNPNANLVTFGVKNTNQIGKDLIQKLKEEKFIFHTIDKMSEGGRAIDVDIKNPLTGRLMTGSSSGGCANILLGINDFSIGTDGGGSVLGPAMSTNLYGIMAKGLGLRGNESRSSTDNIDFVPGIGVISYDYQICLNVVKVLTLADILSKEEISKKRIKVAIPKDRSIILPTGSDMRKMLNIVMKEIGDIVEFVEVDLSQISSRRDAIKLLDMIFDSDVHIVMTLEGPVDLIGMGDSVLGMCGEIGKNIQKRSGKYLLKVANMINGTAVSIPTNELGMGVLLIGKEGLETGSIVLGLGNMIKDIFLIPSLYKKYFIQSYLREDKGFI